VYLLTSFYLTKPIATEPPTTTTPGSILSYAPPDLLYKKTAAYYWPNFDTNVTSLSDTSLNIGGWNAKTGVANGPIGFGSDVKLTTSQVSHKPITRRIH
jgi:hypothetical protein